MISVLIVDDEYLIRSLIRKAAPTDATILITGESGSGKEVVADCIYGMSRRKDKPFVKINCAAIPPNLLEAELFGYERGAFTGANARKIGLFEVANHGTILLDEIGDFPLELQPKLLRVLQERTVTRVGMGPVGRASTATGMPSSPVFISRLPPWSLTMVSARGMPIPAPVPGRGMP